MNDFNLFWLLSSQLGFLFLLFDKLHGLIAFRMEQMVDKLLVSRENFFDFVGSCLFCMGFMNLLGHSD